MAQENYVEGCSMQRPPLLEQNVFCFWKACFETYVKSKDINLWQVIQNGDFYYEVEDFKTKLMKETPYKILDDNQKKKLGKNNEAKMTLYNALPQNSQVKNCKIDLLTQEYEKFSISNEETIDSGFTRFNAIVTSLKSLDPGHSIKNHVRKFLRALPLKWRGKLTAIEEAKDLATLALDELIRNLKVYEMVLDNDDVESKTTKEKVKSLDLKYNITKGQTSNNSTCQDKSDEDKEINLMAKNLGKLSRKGIKVHDKFDICKVKIKGGESSRRKRECYNCGNKNHLANNCPKPNNKELVGVTWSDSEDDEKTQNDATCLMAIDSQEVQPNPSTSNNDSNIINFQKENQELLKFSKAFSKHMKNFYKKNML
ncbi:zf-CCHC domain-containing protein [Tanacetum coccineum]